jgi:ATP-dependent exoDNAse (exonuclease V) beta subunit
VTRAAGSQPGPATAALDHKRILASAGAGKTYQLTSRYLQLVATGAEPGTILATTFTRAAAGEIRDRLFIRLVDAVESDAGRAELADVLHRPDLDEPQALELLATLARAVHRMNIRTLDSFFASVVTAFAAELGLPAAGEVVDEATALQLRQEAIRLVLDERDPQPLINLLRRLTLDATDRAITPTIDRAVADLHEFALDAAPDAWDILPPPRDRLKAVPLVEAVQTLQDADPTTDKRFIKAHLGDCERARREAWGDFLTNGLARSLAIGNGTFQRKPVPEDLVAAYRPVIDHARAVVIGGLRGQAAAMQDLLHRFHAQFESVKRRRRALTFADLTHAMHRAVFQREPADLDFRLDATVRHLLLDEFQDTSVGQWRALSPLAARILGDAPPARSFFCVGDVKQSIYGWRGAAPEILDRLPEIIDGGQVIADEPLHKSWRSSQVVIDVVNRVFQSLPNNGALAKQPDAAATWDQWFEEHTTARDLPGYVELRFGPAGRLAAERDPGRLRAAAELVANLHAGQPDLEIGVLTRSNKAEARLLYELGPAGRGIPVTGRGGGPLTDAPAVNAVLDLLQLADHPDDTAAAFNVGRSPLGEAIGAGPDLHAPAGAPARERLARDVRRRLLDDGYATTIAGWTSKLAPACDARQVRRLLQLVELGDRFDANASLRTDDFIAFVEATSVPQRGPAPVQVMTVHQAKGLEFDIVVLPELDSKLTGVGTPRVVVERDGPTGPIRRICPYVPTKQRPLMPELMPLFEQHEQRTVRESLCVLYVAMTRARQGLYMLINPPASNERSTPQTLAAVVREALANGATEPDSTPFQHGDVSWLSEPRVEKAAPLPPRPPLTPIRLAPAGKHVRFGATVAPPSAHEAPASAQLRLPDTDAQDRGTAIHALLEQVEWIEDWTADQSVQRDLLRLVLPNRDDAWCAERIAELETILQHDAVREALARADRDAARLSLYREHPFARLVETRLQRGTIDRLEVELDASGAPARARVIDFKTDRVEAADATQAAEGYRHQLEVYRAAASDLLSLEAKSIELIVLFVGPGVAVRLES